MASLAVVKAVQSARFTQTRLLVQLGSDVNGKDAEGKTPLIHALLLPEAKVRTSFLRLLLKAGAAVSQPDNKKRNALMWACTVTGCEEVRLLLRHCDEDLDLNAQNILGQTALWLAVDGGKVDTVREVLQALSRYELNSEVADHCGISPAMRAAALGHLDCLRALIAHLNTVTKSSRALMNLAKLNNILTSMSVRNQRKTVSLTPRPSTPETKTLPTPNVPTIQIISSEDTQPVDSARPHTEPGSSYALFSLKFHRDPTRCSTPVSVAESADSISPEPLASRQESFVSLDSDAPDPPVAGGSGIEKTVTPKKRRTPVKKSGTRKSGDQGQIPMERRRSARSKSPKPVKNASTEKSEDQVHIQEEHKGSALPAPSTPLKNESIAVESENQQQTLNERKTSESTSSIPDNKKNTTAVPENQKPTSDKQKNSSSISPAQAEKLITTITPENQGYTPNEHRCYMAIASAPLKMPSATVKFENQQPTMAERQRSDMSSSRTPSWKSSSPAKPENYPYSLQEHKRFISSAPWTKTSAKVKPESQRRVLYDNRLSVSTRPFTVPAGNSAVTGPQVRPRGMIVLQPLASVTMVRGSIRDSLPGLFDVIAQQTSASFRKPAVKPKPKPKIIKVPQVEVSPVPETPAVPVLKSLRVKRSKWGKLKGMAVLSGLSRVKSAAAAAAAGGKISPRPKARQRKSTPAAQPCSNSASP